MKLKVCGMKYEENILELAKLQPDYMGFIFYKKSGRFVSEKIPEIDSTIKKVGVFVDADFNFIQQKVKDYDLQTIQLHGNESVDFCRNLKKSFKNKTPEIIKAFAIKDEFNFSLLEEYLDIVDYFLFDTKGKQPGGNGYTFDWQVLKEYPFQKPFMLSGGIGLNEIEKIKAFQQLNLPLYGIDVNSKFEIEPGRKNIENLKKFKTQLL
ncbi:phosphoribosylanthranilate isomerase [Mesonia aestuariivivens]|uniref:N-(5'-phosphoribosyl)anthranilate isomerase n=1 Tax=Mesonia aestuariivivens TaxID=2796128 RepID=A0ABS6W049_9FLAO|nr:phosphoribosylanthranilate isomerase [Mesonia aestuariivivens]MBW2960896.1 phosphoribosylanthranilate isomerase [Mesonia aestuariivivens]